MAHGQRTHFFTDFGALCGASPPYAWSMNEARTTCGECLSLLEEGLRTRPVVLPPRREGVVVRGRFRSGR